MACRKRHDNVCPPSHPPTASFAQPAGYGGAKRCFAKPRLRPPRGGGD